VARWVGGSGATARIGSGWPWGLLSAWRCSRWRPVFAAVSGRGGTMPRSGAQVWGVFPGGRAHRAAVGLRGWESTGSGRVSRRGCRLSVSWRNRSSAAGRFAIVLPVGLGGEPGRVAEGALAELCTESVLDVQAAPDLVTRVSSGTERAVTPTTRVAPPDLGHMSTADSSYPGRHLQIGWARQVVQARPSVARLRIWRLGVRIPRGAHHPMVSSLAFLPPGIGVAAPA
jgi:hypothetical protein